MIPFRFGVGVGLSRSRAEWVEKARKIEELGYDVLTVPDHLTDLFAPMPAVLSAAEATTTLRVGTNVLNNDLRHPVLVAREAATVDLLSDGRLQLGLGAGSIKSEYDQAGLGFDPGGTRVERLSEAVTIIKGLLTVPVVSGLDRATPTCRGNGRGRAHNAVFRSRVGTLGFHPARRGPHFDHRRSG
jgi:probable F420-dependent oxidoreductase